MIKNYFKIAWRQLRQNKGYAALNIAGLASGMAIALLIGLWILDEINFDHSHSLHSRIAKGMITQSANGESSTDDQVSMAMGQAFRTKYKDLFSSVALTCGGGDQLIGSGDKKLIANAIWAQHELPEIFTFKMISGIRGAIKDPSSTLISRSLATALFGSVDPMMKTLRINNSYDLAVGGVYEDLPVNSSFYGIKILLPWDNKVNGYHNQNTNWNDHCGQLYVALSDHITAEQASARIKHLPTPFIKGWQEVAMVFPLDKAHLYNEFHNGQSTGGRIRFVWLFGIICGFVLLLACINFMNLSTARSEKRAKEVGIRKTIGSRKRQLIGQFLGESILLALLSFVVSLFLVVASLPFFNSLAAKQMELPWRNATFWVLSFAFILITGILAGSYPAFYLSRFNPVRVLKGTFRAGKYASLPRQALVVLQFSVSIALIIGTCIVYRQIQFAKSRPVGYAREGLLAVDINTADLYNHYEALRQDLLQSGQVENVSLSSMKLTAFNNNNGLYWRGISPGQKSIFFRNVNVSREFGRTVAWKVLSGRDFSRQFASDSSAMILNQAAVNKIGIKDPVGETMKFGGKNYTVIGVVNDMITNSPYDTVEPAIFLGDGYISDITIRIKPGHSAHTAIAAMGQIFKKYNPGSPFVYQFMDDEYEHKFESEERIGNLSAVFTCLAIFISCLGLFGLAAFVAEQRIKEIGVRKILGASVANLWVLMSREFLLLVLISCLIAAPVALHFLSQWLERYSYHTQMPWWIFAFAGMGALLIALITVSFQSIRAALASPVKNLRVE